MKFRVLISLLLALMFSSGCKRYSPEEESYIKTIVESRAKKDAEMKSEPTSPFNRDTNTQYAPLKYFAVDPAFVFKSILTRYTNQDTVITYGTKGEERKAVRVGYLAFEKDGNSYRINVYKGKSKTGQEYHSIWFTDLTTGKETYSVGRYIDIEVNPDTSFVYTLDFNLAYSPYCSYSAIYSCAIPTKEDFINLRIEAGEKKFHQ